LTDYLTRVNLLTTVNYISYMKRIIITIIILLVLILYGGNDIHGSDYKNIYERFDNSNIIILKKSGYLPWLQNGTEYYSIIDKFYREYK